MHIEMVQLMILNQVIIRVPCIVSTICARACCWPCWSDAICWSIYMNITALLAVMLTNGGEILQRDFSPQIISSNCRHAKHVACNESHVTSMCISN